jgi:hypothetical protein
VVGACLPRRCALLAVGFLAACTGDGRELARQPSDEGSPAQTTVEWPCEQQGYPCTWEEVSAAATERSMTLGQQAVDRFEPGGADALVAWLRAQPGVTEAGQDDPTAVWFRVDGGRPILVNGPYPPSALEQMLQGQSHRTALAPAHPVEYASIGAGLIGGLKAIASWATSIARAERGPPLWVTGRDRNHDSRVNQRDRRKALILESMWWQDCYNNYAPEDKQEELKQRSQIQAMCQRGQYESAGEKVRKILESSPVYRGNVTDLRNEQVDFDAIASWREYDIVHIEGHGSKNSICLGTDITYPGHGKLRGAAAKRHGVRIGWFRAGKTGPRRAVWCVDRGFFRKLYPHGLGRTLIFVNVCSTLGDPDRPAPPVAEQLLGKETMYVGWGGVTDRWYDVSPNFYTYLVQGYTGSEAIKRLGERFSTGYGMPIVAGKCAKITDPKKPVLSDRDLALADGKSLEEFRKAGGRKALYKRVVKECEDSKVDAGAVLGWRGADMRIREIVQLYNPSAMGVRSEKMLQDGDDLEPIVIGELGDGVDDQLRVSVEIRSILVQFTPFSVQLVLDGVPLDAPELVTRQDIVQPGPIYRKDLDGVPAKQDLKPGREYELEVVVRLPEGGESRYSAKLKSEDCPVVQQGDFAGTIAGRFASRVFERGQGAAQVKFLPTAGAGGSGPAFHLEKRDGGRDGWNFSMNVALKSMPVAGARIRVSDNSMTTFEVGANYKRQGEQDGMGFYQGDVSITVHRLRWVNDHRGMACGEVEAKLMGLQPDTYPYVWVPHTFTAKFWAEVRR